MKRFVTRPFGIALSSLGFNNFLPRFAALIAIVAILIPTLFIIPAPKVSAREVAPSYVAAPPEAFVIGGGVGTMEFVASSLSLIATSISSLFLVAAKPPEGLENAKTLEPQITESSNSANSAPMYFSINATNRFDFDGDAKSDISRFQRSAGEWRVKNSGNGAVTNTILGSATSKIVPADYDGDTKTDLATFDNGVWTIKKSGTNTTITTSFGISTDKPVVGDYDGDQKADIAVYRAGTWYVQQSSNGAVTTTSFGNATDIPVVGDYDGDGKNDFAVFRPIDGNWHLLSSGSGGAYSAFQWGISSDVPVPADYDGDGKTDFSVFRVTTGTWYVSKSGSTDGSYIAQAWGNYGDQPTPADYDGDGKADFSVWRPTTGVWHTINSNYLLSNNPQFTYETLGISGDTAVQSAYLKQTGSSVSSSALAKARLAPINETGGTSLYSRNFGWGTGLVGLSGRGLNAGFGIGYNSLVWTKQTSTTGTSMVFDVDNSNVSPGFRFGFPVIEPSYFDKSTNRYNFMMVSPNGSRTEFRQIGATNVYETGDSSYTQLTFSGASSPNSVENLSITVTGTDGTAMSYEWNSGAYRCTQVKDANGNFITITHNTYGLLTNVKDTLGRIINVIYNADLQPTAITQMWQNGLHTYATLSYKDQQINTDFNGTFAIYGPPNGTMLKVLDKITFADASSVRFDYNGYGQVRQVNNHAGDGHKLNHTRTNLDSVSGVQPDCPRFTETRNYVENFNGGNETLVKNEFIENEPYTLPDGGSATGTMLKVYMIGDPHNRVSKTYTGNSGWKEGLPIKTEDLVNNVQKRWTWTDYTQDDINLTYIQNPRVTESKVGDTENGYVRKTSNTYWSAAEFNLPKETFVYDSNQTTILKKSYTEYNLSSVYTNRRIIGLPSKTETYGLENFVLKLTGKATYAYDEGNLNDSAFEQNINPIQHDNTNFGSTFNSGRGNTTSVTRWNAEFPDDSSQAQRSQVKYNTAGSPVASIDVMNRIIKTSYIDSWNTSGSPTNTFAYPTKLTDPAGNFSEIKYRYDVGENVWAKSPTVAGNAANSGKETTREFDSIGRPIKETLVNTGAYTRYEYLTNQIQSKVYTTVTDADNNSIINTADEVVSESWADGAGRTRMSRTELPNSTGGFSGSMVEYDILGQAWRSTVPTEINLDWIPTGDDYRGLGSNNQPIWLWTSQEFDWKGRITREINTDGTDRFISYTGCGCAGGQVTTIQGELVPRDDIPTQNARRTQKIYSDILGRTYKTESLKWDGIGVYSTNLTAFNGRDQETSVIQQDNSQTPMISQVTTMTYDGHGRIKTQHRPEQTAGTNTIYNYNIDNSIQSTVDARGVITNYTYDFNTTNRGLLMGVSYSAPSGSSIPVTPSVIYTYNNLGMRTSMTDGTGSVNYVYNHNAQITQETKTFTGLSGSFSIGYSYHMNGSLKSVFDPNDVTQTVTYGYNRAGTLTDISGNSGYLIQNRKVRAFGGLKQEDYGSGFKLRQQFDTRLRVQEYDIQNSSQQSVSKTSYEYNNSGQVKRANGGGYFDRVYGYDHAERMTSSQTSQTGTTDYPSYSQMAGYDAFNNLTTRSSQNWGYLINSWSQYQNNRNIQAQSFNSSTGTLPVENWQYDASGNAIQSGEQTHKFDTAGRKIESNEQTPTQLRTGLLIQQNYDGDGRVVKRFEQLTYTTSQPQTTNEYFLLSSVLDGATIAKVTAFGVRGVSSVYEPSGGKIAANESSVKYFHEAPFTGTTIETTTSNIERKEYEPFGGEVATTPPLNPSPDHIVVGNYQQTGNPLDAQGGCQMDGLPEDCSLVIRIPRRRKNGGKKRMEEEMERGLRAYSRAQMAKRVGCPDGQVEVIDADGNPQCVGVNETVTVDTRETFPKPIESENTIFRGIQQSSPFGRTWADVPYFPKEVLDANRKSMDDLHKRIQDKANSGLNDCYRDGMTAYNSTSAERNRDQAKVDYYKQLSPLRLDGVTGGALTVVSGETIGRFVVGYKAPLVTTPGPNTISVFAKGGLRGGLQATGKAALGKMGWIGVTLSGIGASLHIGEYFVGREAALRNIIADCNKRFPNASNPISPYSTYLSSTVNGRIGN